MDNYDLTNAYNKPQIAEGISSLAYQIYAQKAAAMGIGTIQYDQMPLGTEQAILDSRKKQRAAKNKAWDQEFTDNKRGFL